MGICVYCGTKQKKQYPLCHVCGTIRYQVESIKKTRPALEKRFHKLKLSASVAVALVTPGAFIVLAALGLNHINQKRRNKP